MKRFKMRKRHSKKLFRHTAKRVHRKNHYGGHYVMRGGIRL